MSRFKLNFNRLSSQYLQALAESDLAAILALFHEQAIVISPLYETLSATEFYTTLLQDTQNSKLKLKDTLINEQLRSGALFFQYNWVLASGEKVTFDVMDYILLNEDYQIKSLQIIYDTQHARPVWQEQKEA